MTTLRRLSLAAAICAISAGPLAAQRPGDGASSDPNIARIWRVGMDSSHVKQSKNTN